MVWNFVLVEFICIWCNDRQRTFNSLDGVRMHMKALDHCKMLFESVELAEYSDFYDYSSIWLKNSFKVSYVLFIEQNMLPK